MPLDTKLKLLVTEPNDDLSYVLEKLLDLIGCTVVTAKNGLEALVMARTTSPDVIVTELCLPDISGLVLARKIRSTPGCSNILLVAFTSIYSPSITRDTLDAGFDRYVLKPALLGTFLEVLRPIAVAQGCRLLEANCENAFDSV
jgi:CheY-like chemotaxis protein